MPGFVEHEYQLVPSCISFLFDSPTEVSTLSLSNVLHFDDISQCVVALLLFLCR